MEHYAQVTEAYLQIAAKMSLLKVAHNAAQYGAVQNGNEHKAPPNKHPENADLPLVTASYNSVQEPSMPGTGVEPARSKGH